MLSDIILGEIIGAVIGAVIAGVFSFLLGMRIESRRERNAQKREQDKLKVQQDQSRKISYPKLSLSFQNMCKLYLGPLKVRVDQKDAGWFKRTNKGAGLPRVAPPDEADARAYYHKLTSDEIRISSRPVKV